MHVGELQSQVAEVHDPMFRYLIQILENKKKSSINSE
jgi:hypothetical protein